MKSLRAYCYTSALIVGSIHLLFQIFVTPRLSSHLLQSAASTGIVVVILILLTEMMRSKIVHSLKTLEDCLQEFSKGNFLATLCGHLQLKELKNIEEFMVQLRDRMKNWIYNILYSEVHLENLAKNLSDSSKISLNHMQQISGRIQEMMEDSTKAASDSAENAAISEELLSSNTEIAAYSNNAKDFALEAVNSIDRDSRVIKEALDNIDEVETLMKESAAYIGTLKQLLDSISGMAEAISAIASQTNLLSLNASIEAARAGETGRGFGVVANEIKKLADQSASTVTQINENIASIQASIHDTVEVMNKGVQKAVDIRKVSDEASKNLLHMHEKIKAMLDLISNISQNVMEQNNATEALAKNIESIAHFTNETDKITRQIDEKVKEQVIHNEGNVKISDQIANIAEQFNHFILPIEKEIDAELIAACYKIGAIVSKGRIDNDLLDRISSLTGITEIYITDDKGVIRYSNNPTAIGFAFSNDPNAQTYEFYRILENPGLQVCQRMRMRDLDGKYFKIVGISRTDGKGIIQVGLSLEDIVDFKGHTEINKIQ